MLTKQLCFLPAAPNILVQSPVPRASLLPSPWDPSFSTPSPAHTVITLAPPPPLIAFPGALTVSRVWVRASDVWGSRVPDWRTHNLPFSIIQGKHQQALFPRAKMLSPDRKGILGNVQRHYDNAPSLWRLRKTTLPPRTKFLILHSAFLQPLGKEGRSKDAD